MLKQLIIIFCRYPESGQTKTRLIRVLGADKAAFLSKKMTEFTINEVRKIPNINYQVYFTGGNINLMKKWLGNDVIYQEQIEGDLGDRMSNAIESNMNKYPDGVMIIGTDCPDLTCDIMEEGLMKLLHNDLVLGKAKDGGYYLMGMANFYPQLFEGISWSTSKVLEQSLKIAKSLNLSVDFLPTLSDIDNPEDLWLYPINIIDEKNRE
jgi:uncharacterized protein